MRIRSANRLIQTIGTYKFGRLELRKRLLEKRDRRAVAKRERELERAIRNNGLGVLLEPHGEEIQAPRRAE